MNILDSIVNAPVYIIGISIIAAVFIMAGIRYKDNKAILNRYPREQISLMTYGVNFFGQESVEKKPSRSTGGLVLVEDGLYYHARFGKRKHFIEGNRIRAIGTTDTFAGKPLYQKVIFISYINEEGNIDRAVYRIPHPAHWVEAIKKTLIET